MEEKKVSKRHNSVGTFFKLRGHNNYFSGRSLGFTLVELLTVIGILGILLVAVLTILNPVAQIEKANDSRRKSDLAEIQKALETYNQDNNGKYPSSSADYKIVYNSNTVSWGSKLLAPYMTTLPKDPVPTRNYVYYSNGQSYWIYASLQRSNDPQLCNVGNPCTNLPSGATCGTNATCNFGVSSPNTSP